MKIRIFFISIAICLLYFSALKVTGLNIQDELNTKLREIEKKHKAKQPKTEKPVNRTHVQNMRQSSDLSRKINEEALFALNFALTSRQKRSTTQVNGLAVSSDVCPFKNVSVCDSSSKYRTYNGTCNNLNVPLYGASNTPYKRILSPAYNDGLNTPRTQSVNGLPLPNVRVISQTISPTTPKQKFELNITHLFPIFGQFLTHDITGTSTSTDSNDNEVDCPCGSTDPSCFSVVWPSNDPFLNQKCMKFVRSSASYPDLNCTIGYREQLNLLSSFIDGNAIYGINEDRAKELRTFTGGQLKTSNGIPASSGQKITGRSYLPLSSDTCSASATDQYKCFLAGEYRTSENLALVSMHTLFNREHNRIASILAKQTPSWSDEKLYQETRRIVIAQLQHIVYNEWFPIVSGDTSLSPLKTNTYYKGYDKSINPQLTNEFATAGLRLGHSLIRDIMAYYDVDLNRLRPFNFTNITFKSDLAYNTRDQGLNAIFNGLLKESSWKFGSFSNELQNKLFSKIENGTFSATDLLATNINRGRDHGLQPYIKYLKYCFNMDIKTFSDLNPLFSPQIVTLLSSLYNNVNDIDLYVGGLLEKQISSITAVGPTFGCLVSQQFKDLKNGDRFYYENEPVNGVTSSTAFKLEQLAEIKKLTLSGLICNNYDVSVIQLNPFYNPSTTNQIVECSKLINQIDLSKWANEI